MSSTRPVAANSTTGLEYLSDAVAMVLDPAFDVDSARSILSQNMWQAYWTALFEQTDFRCGKASLVAAGITRRSISTTTSVQDLYVDLSQIEWDNGTGVYDLHQFPPQISGFRGSIAERHCENMVILNSLGPDLYKRILQIHSDSQLKGLFQAVADFEGYDVHWAGHVNERMLPNHDPSVPPRAIPGTSKTQFGIMRVCRFPFAVEIEFDDCIERTSISLVTAICDDTIELFIADLHQFVADNASERIALHRYYRACLRCLSFYQGEIELTLRRFGGYGMLAGTISVDQKEHRSQGNNQHIKDPTNALEPGFNVRLLGTKVVSTTGLACSCLFPNGDVMLKDIADSRRQKSTTLNLDSEFVRTIAASVPEDTLLQFEADFLAKYRRRQVELHRNRTQVLDYSFHGEIFADPTLDLVNLSKVLKADFPAIFSRLTIVGLDPDLIQLRVGLTYLRICSRPDVYWICFWIQVARHHPERIPAGTKPDLKDLNSFLYQQSSVKEYKDLITLGFSQFVLDESDLLKTFWKNLELLRLRQFYKNTSVFRDAISAVRLEAIKCGCNPERVNALFRVDLPKGMFGTITASGLPAAFLHGSTTMPVRDPLDEDDLADIVMEQKRYDLAEEEPESDDENEVDLSTPVNLNVIVGAGNGSPPQSLGLASVTNAKKRWARKSTMVRSDSEMDDRKMKFTFDKVKKIVSVIGSAQQRQPKPELVDVVNGTLSASGTSSPSRSRSRSHIKLKTLAKLAIMKRKPAKENKGLTTSTTEELPRTTDTSDSSTDAIRANENVKKFRALAIGVGKVKMRQDAITDSGPQIAEHGEGKSLSQVAEISQGSSGGEDNVVSIKKPRLSPALTKLIRAARQASETGKFPQKINESREKNNQMKDADSSNWGSDSESSGGESESDGSPHEGTFQRRLTLRMDNDGDEVSPDRQTKLPQSPIARVRQLDLRRERLSSQTFLGQFFRMLPECGPE